ncbi:hypothetical protein ARMSODRAFT_1028131 [Armillaria solidipes]|uniref:Uncharacterized protein n=1 Tax=Armillaria solidipes TaxID=1076256 RepID=A0A2H3AI73_9AGAR|nr:hypothetical protein ARMSODRAFT_1028131 [Armillaria solidipes]
MDPEPSSSTSRKRKIDRPRAKNVSRQSRGSKKGGKGKNRASQASTDSSAADEEDEPLEKRPRTQASHKGFEVPDLMPLDDFDVSSRPGFSSERIPVGNDITAEAATSQTASKHSYHPYVASTSAGALAEAAREVGKAISGAFQQYREPITHDASFESPLALNPAESSSVQTKKEQQKVLLRLRDLLGGAQKEATNQVSVSELRRYVQNLRTSPQAVACGITTFRVNLAGTPTNCPWNRSAAQVFITDYMERYHSGSEDALLRKSILSMFHQRIARLRREWLERNKQEENQRLRLAAATAESQKMCRKKALHERRQKLANRVPELNRHSQLLTALGPEGMSSDEEADGTFEIQSPNWRSPELNQLLKQFDEIDIIISTRQFEQDGCTLIPDVRHWRGSITASKKFVSGLPRNAYEAKWLNGLQENYVRVFVRPRADEHQFDNAGLESFVKGMTFRASMVND